MRHSKTPNIDSNQKHGLKTTFMCQMASNDVGINVISYGDEYFLLEREIDNL